MTLHNLAGAALCGNPKCRRPLYRNFVSLTSERGKVRLCLTCWQMPIDKLPEAQNAVADSREQARWRLP